MVTIISRVNIFLLHVDVIPIGCVKFCSISNHEDFCLSSDLENNL